MKHKTTAEDEHKADKIKQWIPGSQVKYYNQHKNDVSRKSEVVHFPNWQKLAVNTDTDTVWELLIKYEMIHRGIYLIKWNCWINR